MAENITYPPYDAMLAGTSILNTWSDGTQFQSVIQHTHGIPRRDYGGHSLRLHRAAVVVEVSYSESSSHKQ